MVQRGRRTAIGVLACVLAVPAGLAFAGSTPSKTTSSAKKQVTVSSPSKTPVTIGKISRGKPLPKGYSVVSREVKVTRGKSSTTSSNYVSLSCPGLLTVSALADSSSLGHPMPFTYNKEQTFGAAPCGCTRPPAT